MCVLNHSTVALKIVAISDFFAVDELFGGWGVFIIKAEILFPLQEM